MSTLRSTCTLCDAEVAVEPHRVVVHEPPTGAVRVAFGCPACDVLAVRPSATTAARRLVAAGAAWHLERTPPWEHDALGHDAVCVASPRTPEHDVAAPPLTAPEVDHLVAHLRDDDLAGLLRH